MRWQTGTTTVTGNAVQVVNSSQKVRAIEFHADAGNAGTVRLGESTVTATTGRGLAAGETHEVDFTGFPKDGSVPFSTFYIHGDVSGDTVDYSVVLA